MKIATNRFSVHDINIEVNSGDDKFLDKVIEEYNGYESNFNRDDTHIKIFFHGYKSFAKNNFEVSNYKKIGTGIFINENQIIMSNKQMLVKAKVGEKLEIEATYYERLDHTIRKIYQNQIESNNYNHLVRLLVHYPLITYLNFKKNIEVIHASTIEKNGEAVVFTGFNGSGKSTLTSYFHFVNKYNLLADNFTLIDNSCAYSFPETVKVSKEMLELYGIKKGVNDVYSKTKLKKDNNVEKAKIKAIVFVKINNKSETVINKITKDEALYKITSMHNFLAEFPQHSYFVGLPFLEIKQHVSNTSCLPLLLQNVDIYEIELGYKANIKKIAEEVENEIFFT